MGLHEKPISNSKFLVIKHHALCLESKEPKDGYEPITVRNPKTDEELTKYIKRFAAVDGLVKRIEWYDSGDKYSTRFMGLKIHLKDGGNYYQLDLPMQTRHYDSFTKLADNIDFSQVVEFHVWYDRKQDSTAFAVKQNDEFVQWKYTKDDMGDCPVPIKDAFDKWDFREQKAWLLDHMRNVIIPKVDALRAFDEPEPEYSGDGDEPIQQSREAPDDPFDDEAMSRDIDPPDEEIGQAVQRAAQKDLAGRF